MSTFGGIHRAYSGLYAHRRRIDVIGDNIANVDTPGYSRQRINLSPVNDVSPGLISGRGGTAGGVSVEDVTRMRNQLLSAHARTQAGVAADRDVTADYLLQLEQIVGGLEEGGLRDQVTALFNSFDDLASSPEDPALRRVVLQRGESVAQGFSRATTAVDQLRNRAVAESADIVRSINLVSGEIADLDAEILGAMNTGSSPNALLDMRDVRVAELTELAGVDVVEHADGQVQITLDGQLLVSNGTSTDLALDTKTDPALAAIGYDKIVVVSPSGRELSLRSGRLAANLHALATVVPDGRRDLDGVAADLAAQVNTIHQAGSGLDGSTGLAFFEHDPVSGDLFISADVDGNPDGVAAAALGAGALDNTTARSLAHLAEDPNGPIATFSEMVGSLAAKAGTAVGSAEAAAVASEQAANLALAAGGVSLDEELTDLITAQRSYEAAARLMTAVDEMLQVLISSTGLVGR